MNSNWRNRPTTIDVIPPSADYVISIDENGSANLKKVLQAKRMGTVAPENEQHFTICACVIRRDDFAATADMVMNLKRKYWKDALYAYNGQTKRVCFHSKEIRGRKEAFHPNTIDYESFIVDLTQLVKDIPMTVYASHIDKVKHVTQYAYPDSPYDLCMNFVLERIMRDIGDKRCIVILESRGQKEDKELLGQIKHLIDHGNRYTSPSQFSKICGVYFNPKWSKEYNCQKSYWSLEIADVCSYPIYKFFAHVKKDKAFDVVETKLKNYPNYRGRGLKTFP